MQTLVIKGFIVELPDAFNLDYVQSMVEEVQQAHSVNQLEVLIVLAKHLELKKEEEHLIHVRDFLSTLNKDFCSVDSVSKELVKAAREKIKNEFCEDLGLTLYSYLSAFF